MDRIQTILSHHLPTYKSPKGKEQAEARLRPTLREGQRRAEGRTVVSIESPTL